MEVAAKIKHIRTSAQKVRLVADQIRGKDIESALNILSFSPKKAAGVVKKALNSAIANAEHNNGADIDELKVSQIYVDEGPVSKRFRARARGRAAGIIKRSCHITVKVADSAGDQN